MHELSIAAAVLDQLEAEQARRPGTRFLKVGLRIGELSGVDPDALSFGFEALVKDTHWEPLALAIESIPWEQRCGGCGHVFRVRDAETECPQCAARDTRCAAGQELDIAYIEVEEDGTGRGREEGPEREPAYRG